MPQAVEFTVDYDEDGFRIGRYPWWELKEPGDVLLLHGRLLEVRKVQTAASIWAKRRGIRLATRDVSVDGSGRFSLQVYFQERIVERPKG